MMRLKEKVLKLSKSKVIYISCCALFLIALVSFIVNMNYSYAIPNNVLMDRGDVKEQVLYLSDIPFDKAQVGWGKVSLDKTQSDTPLTLVLDGVSTVFAKGIWAHATSTIEYNISEYKDYAYFITYYGLNTTAQNTGNGVKFYVYTSKDGKDWTLRTEEDPVALKGVSNAQYLKIDIRDANYIRLYAYDNGSNASDHAIWADTKLAKEGYTDDIMLPIEEFDKVIKSRYNPGPINDDLKLTLLQRNFIKKVGQYQLRLFVDSDPKNKEMLEWFINNEDALRLWTIGGTPNGGYPRALQVLSNLYRAYKDDLENEGVTQNGTKYKDLYLRMMLALSLTHSSNVGLWVGGNQLSDAVTRYDIYKKMHLNNQLFSSTMFENYTVEEMRWLMHVNIDDEEIMWLHDYSLKHFPNVTQRFSPYSYINYTFNYNYHRPQYYSQANYATWDQKYELSKYNITYQSGKPKLWIVFEEGAVCGGISKTAANVYGVWGVPASVVGQPAHAAYIYYYDVGGKGAWQLSYNVAPTGWANTQGYSRMPNDWGNFSSGVVTNSATIKSASYFFLAQEAQNEYEKYETAEMILLLEDIYKNDNAKLERIYRDALKEEIINWDAWLGLVRLYIADNTKTEEDIVNLAEEIADVLTYNPLPMYDLTRKLGTKIISTEYKSKLMMIQNQTLKKAKTATGANTLQYKEVPVVAQALLGEVNLEIASFSFDGDNAGKIVLSKQLQSTQVNWSYSLDGGNSWTDCHDSWVQLTKEQIDSIDANNDIKIHISGLPKTDKNIFTIDITKGVFPTNSISVNDNEDRIYGVTNKMEWSLDINEEWNSFANTNPLFTGNKKVYVRIISSGTQIASDPVYFTFTDNNANETKRYIPTKFLNVPVVSGTKEGNKNYIIDGNANTSWRSARGSGLGAAYIPAYVILELDRPRFISSLEYLPDKLATFGNNISYGIAKDVDIYVSLDGINWELAASKKNIGKNLNLKTIPLDEVKQAKYVKFSCPSIYETLYNSLAISEISLYEDTTADETPRAEINYNIVNKTNQDVVAELVNETRHITVTNNNGKTTHTFTENGEFTFEFVDDFGNSGSATATVSWIDKTAPKASVVFSTTEITNENVVATITFDKNVTILSKDVQIAENPVDKSKTITFLENASYELKFQDEHGNIGTKKIAVDWIDITPPTAVFEYSTTDLTDKEVTATLVPSEYITVLNNDGNNTYAFKDNGSFTFEFIDRAGNKGTATANVSWIARMPQYEIHYSNELPTNKNVSVLLELEKGYRIINNDTSNIYTFEDNGEFEFQYIDSQGIIGAIHTRVNWIDKVAPTAELKYVKENGKVTVSVVNPSEEITFKEGNGVYEFDKIGNYEIVFYDKVGNVGSLTAIIDSLINDSGNEEKPDRPVDPKPNPEDPKPEEPSIPEVPNEPTEDNKTEIPNTSTDEKNQANSSKPGNANKPSDNNKPNNSYNQKEEYKEYSSNNVIVKIPSNIIKEDRILKVEEFTLSDDSKVKFGTISEYYDIYLANKQSKRIDLNSSDAIKISIKINKEKEFMGIYTIVGDDIKPVDYEKNGDYFEINANNLGKYIISYKENTTDPIRERIEKNEKRNSFITIIIVSSLIVVCGSTIYVLKKKRNKKSVEK